MSDMWAVKLIPSGSTNSCRSEQEARDLAMMVRGTDAPGCEILHLEDAGWRVVERFEDAQPSHLEPCGCLKNGAGAHRVGCPDHPEGVRGL